MTRESAIERTLATKVAVLGGVAYKWTPTVAGVPDRIVLMPGGRTYFVETKAPGGRLSALQEHRHAQLRRLGFEVAVLWSTGQVNSWLADITDRAFEASKRTRKKVTT